MTTLLQIWERKMPWTLPELPEQSTCLQPRRAAKVQISKLNRGLVSHYKRSCR